MTRKRQNARNVLQVMLRRCCHHSAALPVPGRVLRPLFRQAVFPVAVEAFLPAEPLVRPFYQSKVIAKSLDFLGT